MISLLVLIPIICISFTLYIMSLIDFIINNDLDIILISLGAFISIIISFFVLKVFIRDNRHIPAIMNMDERSSSIHGYFSFIIMFLFGLSLVLNSIIFKINIFNLTIGLIVIVLFIFITIEYIIKSSKIILLLIDIDDIDSSFRLLVFEDESGGIYQYYVSKKHTYILNKHYLCKIQKSSKYIKKIIKEVIEID